MGEPLSSRPADVETPEGSTVGDDNPNLTPAGGKGSQQQQQQQQQQHGVKDRKCQYCQQAFTSSSLGRHLDQFLFKKKPDGVHNVEEIRRIRSGITRRQARTSTGKRDTPERQSDAHGTGDQGGRGPEAPVRMMFNTPTWHATGVINDIPNPNNAQESAVSVRMPSHSRTGSMNLPDYASRGAHSQNPDTVRALELALREVLDNVKAATLRPRHSPFDFDIQSQTFPSLCLQLLPPPPSLFSASPFTTPSSFPLEPPGGEHLDIVRQTLQSKLAQWQTDQLSTDADAFGMGMDSNMVTRKVQQLEDMSLRHVDLAYNHWLSLPAGEKQTSWQLEITRAFAREMEKRKSLDEQLARVQQEANQLRSQVERLGSCQWPREFALFPPDTLPLPRDVARDLDSKESQINPHSPRWDYDNVVAKWRRVVMHDKSMGRIGVGASNAAIDDTPEPSSSTTANANANSNANNASGSSNNNNNGANSNRPKPLQNITQAQTSSPDQVSPQAGASSPYMQTDANRSPRAAGGPQNKRPRLMNGHTRNGSSEGNPAPPPPPAAAAPANSNQSGANTAWNSHNNQPSNVPNLAAPTPPASNSGT